MEQREHIRVQLPFEVEVHHPAIGTQRSIARDVSEGGMFVPIAIPDVKPGAKVRITVRGTPIVESTPTPTIQMEVVRVSDEGVGLKFVNQTSRHLWSTVRRLRDELAVGRDYFQVFQSVLVRSSDDRLLVVEQNGRWLFPGDYLVVGRDWRDGVKETLDQHLGVSTFEHLATLGIDSAPDTHLLEGAVLTVFQLVGIQGRQVKLANNGRYRRTRWLSRPQEVDEVTFSAELLRRHAITALNFSSENEYLD